MTARERVAAARRGLAVAAIASAVMWGAAVFLAVTGIVALLDWAMPLDSATRAIARALSMFAALAATSVALWRARRIRASGAVALWLEERSPALRYALVTAAEAASTDPTTPLERAAASTDPTAGIAATLARALALPIGLIAASFVVLAFLPAGVVERVRSPAIPNGGDASAPAGTVADRLAKVRATIVPPEYSALPRRTVDEPSGITALVASAIALEGRGAPSGLRARVGDVSLPVDGDATHWSVRFAMPRTPAALRILDGARERLVVLEPLPDSAPVVSLLAPARDTVLREPAGTIALAADVHDDLGLAESWLEYIVSSGEGESFTFRSGILARADARGERHASVAAELRLESLKLKPGDLVHLRAVARDRNTASGPDTGVSETRTIRIARHGEYDSVAVEAAPPPSADKAVLSERMLIVLTEELERRRPRLSRDAVIEESGRIARDQVRLRKEVSRVIFSRLGADAESEESQAQDDSTSAKDPEAMLKAAEAATDRAGTALDFEGDETPVMAVNRTLLEAYNAMWDAERRLQVGEPGEALPYMRVALAAIQRARAAERLYLRGHAPAPVVDLAKVRLAGPRDEARSATRSARAALDSTAARRAHRLDAALALLSTRPAAAVDSLLLLRVDALAQDPPFAAALGAALDSLRAGHDATAPLARARRAAAGAPFAASSGASWESGW